MKYVIFLILLCCTLINLQAQKNIAGKGMISGKVIDANTKSPIEYATITVYPAGSNKPVKASFPDVHKKSLLVAICYCF